MLPQWFIQNLIYHIAILNISYTFMYLGLNRDTGLNPVLTHIHQPCYSCWPTYSGAPSGANPLNLEDHWEVPETWCQLNFRGLFGVIFQISNIAAGPWSERALKLLWLCSRSFGVVRCAVSAKSPPGQLWLWPDLAGGDAPLAHEVHELMDESCETHGEQNMAITLEKCPKRSGSLSDLPHRSQPFYPTHPAIEPSASTYLYQAFWCWTFVFTVESSWSTFFVF